MCNRTVPKALHITYHWYSQHLFWSFRKAFKGPSVTEFSGWSPWCGVTIFSGDAACGPYLNDRYGYLFQLVLMQHFAGNTEYIFIFFLRTESRYLREHFSSSLVNTPVNTVWLFCTLNTNISKVWNLCLQNQKTFSVLTVYHKCEPVHVIIFFSPISMGLFYELT